MKNIKIFWNDRKNSIIIAAVAIVAVYFIGLRAIDTGSLQQYFLVLVLLGVAVNRTIHAIRRKK